ncbi:MAG: ferredoxin [bacterium]|nr:ferredoxin [bacterium]
MAFKISVDQEKCIGCGACTSVCDNFQVIDGKSSPVDTEVEEAGCNKDAEEGCPAKAITVEEI